jgi:DNA-binding transcriptional ArsR family regulator
VLNYDQAFAALADPTRRSILARLGQGEATVLELARPFSISQPAVSRHLKVLEDAGLIARRIEGSKRPCRLVPQAIDELDEWLQALKRTLEANFSRLDRVLSELSDQENTK